MSAKSIKKRRVGWKMIGCLQTNHFKPEHVSATNIEEPKGSEMSARSVKSAVLGGK
ncbi:MAG: hypothetical protein ACLR2O_02880 [Coprococcus sp.]